MRFLKASTLSRKNVKNDDVAVDINGQIILGTTNMMLVPKGTTLQRATSPVAGHLRFNTTNGEFEVYQNGAWRNLRFKESSGITQQAIGTGDDIETKFGPLNPAPPALVESGATWGGQNLIVLVENVFQIHNTNYTIEQNPSAGPGAPYVSGYYIVFSEPVPTGKPVTVLHGFDK